MQAEAAEGPRISREDGGHDSWYLQEEVGNLLIKYLMLVRPVNSEAFIAEQIECDGFENHEKMLFTDYERVWDGKRLSEIFMCEMNEHGPTSMGFREYRQIAKFWMRKHLKETRLGGRRIGSSGWSQF